MSFDYREAFSRNLGWVTETEQAILKSKKVAIAGVGGVGGVHLLTLTRLGIGAFNIADLDIFEQANFNRQVGANMQTIGREKVDVMSEMAKNINPTLDIVEFSQGVTLDNIDDFLEGVDLYIDGLDFFVLDIRRAVFKACEEKGIPAITAAPLGMGTAFLNFLPGKMSFEDYFGLEGADSEEQQIRFMLGLSPTMLQRHYLADPSRVRFGDKAGPSTPMGCELCAGVAASNALKILLGRGKVLAAPWGLHFDAYRNELKKTWRPGGHRNWLQRLMVMLVRSFVRKSGDSQSHPTDPVAHDQPLMRVLDAARWAPSGDNTQPWRFKPIGDDRLSINAWDTRDWCFYDLKGAASEIAVGALQETLAIAAKEEGWNATFSQLDNSEGDYGIDVRFEEQETAKDPLYPYIRQRVTQRRAMSRQALTPSQKAALENCLPDGFSVIWLEGKSRWDVAKLLFKSAKIRLTTEEGYRVHSQIIEWDRQYSQTMIPDQAVGLDTMTVRLMRWVMQSWQRVKFMNRFMAGTWTPRLQLDLIPALCCGAHFALVNEKPVVSRADNLAAGRALQRFWLTATQQGLQFQPEMTPLIFSRYVADNTHFVEDAAARSLAQQVAEDLSSLTDGMDVQRIAYFGRVGTGSTPESRSIRRDLDELIEREGPDH